jgi:hypothetical protein
MGQVGRNCYSSDHKICVPNFFFTIDITHFEEAGGCGTSVITASIHKTMIYFSKFNIYMNILSNCSNYYAAHKEEPC